MNGERFTHLVFTGLDMVLPLRCLQCDSLFFETGSGCFAGHGTELIAAFDCLTASFLCTTCRQSFVAIQSPLCTKCGIPFETSHGSDHLCGDCMAGTAHFFYQSRSAGRYKAALRTLVHHFKYQGCVQLADPLGRLLWMVFLSHWDPDVVDAIVPVPLHPKRQRQRGFNQAYQLVRKWPMYASEQGVDMDTDKLWLSLLRRRQFSAPQTGLNRSRRKANVKHAFAIEDPQAVCGNRVLLVDDVLTTGATVHACSQLLKRAGASRVDVLTLARAV